MTVLLNDLLWTLRYLSSIQISSDLVIHMNYVTDLKVFFGRTWLASVHKID
jgi:hypothetical protein